MTDENRTGDESAGTSRNGPMGDENDAGGAGGNERTRRETIEEGLREGLGALGAMRDTIEETIREARERGDLSPERAKQAMREALEKAQEKAGEARDAFDFVKQKDFDGLRAALEELKARMRIVEQEVGIRSDGESSEGEEDAPTS